MEEKIAKCFGDSQQYDGGWFAEYDGKWLDITNEVQNVKQLFLDTIEKAKPEKQDTDRGRHALNMSANGWNNGISTFEANLRKEIGK